MLKTLRVLNIKRTVLFILFFYVQHLNVFAFDEGKDALKVFFSSIGIPCQTTPDEATLFDDLAPGAYLEYARSNNASNGIIATNIGCSGWDVKGYTTSGNDVFVMAGENWGAGSDGGFIYLALESGTQTITSLSFRSNDGKIFDLKSLDLSYDVISNNTLFTITGYKNGVAVVGAVYNVPSFSSFGNGGNWSKNITLPDNGNFIGIDEFRITPNTANQLSALNIDNLTAKNFRVSPSNTPPNPNHH